MDDLVHSAVTGTTDKLANVISGTGKFISYNRYLVIGITLAATLVGCALWEPKATVTELSPDKLSATELQAKLNAKENEIKTTEANRQTTLQAKLDAINQKAQSDAKLLLADETQLLNSEKTYLDNLHSSVQAAQDQMQKQREAIGGVIDFIQTTLTAINPAFGAAFGGASMLLAGGLGLDNRRKDKVIGQVTSDTSNVDPNVLANLVAGLIKKAAPAVTTVSVPGVNPTPGA